jgi:hypothetical protein
VGIVIGSVKIQRSGPYGKLLPDKRRWGMLNPLLGCLFC